MTGHQHIHYPDTFFCCLGLLYMENVAGYCIPYKFRVSTTIIIQLLFKQTVVVVIVAAAAGLLDELKPVDP